MLSCRPMRALPLLAVPSFLAGCVLPAPAPATTATPAAAVPTEDETTATISVDHEALRVDYLLPGAAVEDDGILHLWVVAFGGSSDDPTILHLTAHGDAAWSTDATPVAMDDEALGLDEVGPIPSSVLVEADGTWTMYGGGRRPGDDSILWRATAPGPGGPWELHSEQILEPSTVGWDNDRVDHPSVVTTDDGYLMTYGGQSRATPNRGRIGAAISSDGVAWERVAVTLPGADDAAAIGPSACGIDGRTMFEPELVAEEEGYRLHFGVMRTEPADVMLIGELASDDGTTWRCAIDGPLVEPADVVAGAGLHSYLAIRGRQRNELLIEVLGTEAAFSDLWLVRQGG